MANNRRLSDAIPRDIAPDPAGGMTLRWYTLDRPATVLLDETELLDGAGLDALREWRWPVSKMTADERSLLCAYDRASGLLLGTLLGRRVDMTSSVTIESGWRMHTHDD